VRWNVHRATHRGDHGKSDKGSDKDTGEHDESILKVGGVNAKSCWRLRERRKRAEEIQLIFAVLYTQSSRPNLDPSRKPLPKVHGFHLFQPSGPQNKLKR